MLFPNISHSNFEKNSVGDLHSMDSGRARIHMFYILLQLSKSITLAFS